MLYNIFYPWVTHGLPDLLSVAAAVVVVWRLVQVAVLLLPYPMEPLAVAEWTGPLLSPHYH